MWFSPITLTKMSLGNDPFKACVNRRNPYSKTNKKKPVWAFIWTPDCCFKVDLKNCEALDKIYFLSTVGAPEPEGRKLRYSVIIKVPDCISLLQ